MARKAKSLSGEADLLRIACFALFTALLLHLSHATAAPFAARGRAPWRKFLRAQWRKMGGGVPVLPLASAVLEGLPDSAATEELLARLAHAAEGTQRSGLLARHDFVGRIYRKLLLAAAGPHYATYYTSVPAARLLADLTLRTTHPSWRFDTLGGTGNFSVIDPACGSGTLLAAAYAALRDAQSAAGALHGWDVLDFAAQLALATLTLNAGAAAPRMDASIRALPVGVAKGRVRLGSLDYLREGAGPPRRRHDVVLMNPPFSRSAKPNLTFGYSAAEVRRRMQRALADLAASLGLTGIGRAGLGPYFMMLGLELLAQRGRIGLVVPRSMLSGVSWKKIRARYLDECEIKYIVANFDPGAPGQEPWNWSENTALGEVLVVAERTEKPASERSVTFVNVFRKPRTDEEATGLAQGAMRAAAALGGPLCDGCHRDLAINGARAGALYRVPQEALRRNWLAPAIFAEPELNRLALAVIAHRGLVPFRDLCAAVGPDIAQVKRAFAPAAAAAGFPLVLGHQGDMTTIELRAEKLAHGVPKAANARLLHRRHAACLLVAERPHLGSEALLAMRAPRKVLATAFWEIRPREVRWEAPILLWLNSTYGVLAYLANATSSMGDIVKMKKDQLADMPALDPASVDAAACAGLVGSLGRSPFLPFAAEFARAAAGAGPRHALDRFFGAALALPPIGAALYDRLARDPVVSRKRLRLSFVSC